MTITRISGSFFILLTFFCSALMAPSVTFGQDEPTKEQRQITEKDEDKKLAEEAKKKLKQAQYDQKLKEKQEKEALRNSRKATKESDKLNAKNAGEKMKEAQKLAKVKQKESESGLKWKDLKEVADEFFFEGTYYDAIEYYKKAYELKPKKVCLPCSIAESYQLVRDYQKAEEWFRKVLAIDSNKNKHPLARYYLALNMKKQGKYEEAVDQFNIFRGKIAKSKKEQLVQYKRFARRERLGAEQGMAMRDTFTSSRYKVRHLDRNFNSPHFESGAFYADTRSFIYSEMRADIFSSKEPEGLASRFSRLYSAVNIAGNWQPEDLLSGDINQGSIHIGNATLSPDGKNLYYTECEHNGKPGMQCKIFVSQKLNGDWAAGKPLDEKINAPFSSNTFPMLTLDKEGNELMYFVSDREGGRGKMDIWYTIKLPDGSFKRPKNAGGAINTKWDEVTPFFDATNSELYFSSNGHTNIGGLDVFKSFKTDYGTFEKAINLEMPVNSSTDDFHYVLSKNNYNALFSSNRQGSFSKHGETCCEDIYEVTFRKPEFAVQGRLYEEYKGQRSKAKTGAVSLFKASNDSLIGSFAIRNSEPFFFSLEPATNYFLISVKEGFEDLIYNFNTRGLTFSDTLNFDLVMHKLEIEKRSLIGELIGIVYFEYDRFHLTSDAPDVLDTVVNFMLTHPDLVYEVGGHTDNLGSATYNQELSMERALAVRQYILSRNIGPRSIKAVGYGPGKPLAPNQKADGADNPEGRALNRRAEFKIVGELDMRRSLDQSE